jgi:hypothetical protein
MAEEKPPVPLESHNVVPFEKTLRRKRVTAAIAAALKRWPAIETIDARDQMIELDINKSQIIHGMSRAEILEFSEDTTNGRMLFTARLLSAGEEFFVSAAVEQVVPFPDSHVVIRRVWR